MSLYFVMQDGERKGPYPLDRLAEAGVRPDTYIWCKGMADWTKAGDDPEICRMWRNRIHDLMHPHTPVVTAATEIRDRKPAEESGIPTRYDRMLGEEGATLPTVDEIESNRDTDREPAPLTGWAVLAAIFFFPLGIPALVYARKCRKLWREGAEAVESGAQTKRAAHDAWSSARMFTGLSFFVGLIFWASVINKFF